MTITPSENEGALDYCGCFDGLSKALDGGIRPLNIPNLTNALDTCRKHCLAASTEGIPFNEKLAACIKSAARLSRARLVEIVADYVRLYMANRHVDGTVFLAEHFGIGMDLERAKVIQKAFEPGYQLNGPLADEYKDLSEKLFTRFKEALSAHQLDFNGISREYLAISEKTEPDPVPTESELVMQDGDVSTKRRTAILDELKSHFVNF